MLHAQAPGLGLELVRLLHIALPGVCLSSGNVHHGILLCSHVQKKLLLDLCFSMALHSQARDLHHHFLAAQRLYERYLHMGYCHPHPHIPSYHLRSTILLQSQAQRYTTRRQEMLARVVPAMHLHALVHEHLNLQTRVQAQVPVLLAVGPSRLSIAECPPIFALPARVHLLAEAALPLQL